MAIANGIIDGLLIGCVYGGVAMGLSLIFGVMNLLNLAYGGFIILGLTGAYVFNHSLGINALATLPLVLALGYLLGLLLYRYGGLSRVVRSRLIMVVVFTFGLDVLISGAISIAFPATGYSLKVPGFMSQVWTVGSVTLPAVVVWAAVGAVLIVAAVDRGLRYTGPGRRIRAARQNPVMAALNGVNVAKVYSQTFGVGTAIACGAGVLIGLTQPFSVSTDSQYLVIAFAVTVIGGLGQIWGVLLAGLLYGAIEGVMTVVVGPTWGDVVAFGLLLVVLIVRPLGLAGSRYY